MSVADARRRVLSGRYELLEKIGSGGMADVFHARDLRLRRDVAVKVLRNLDKDPAFAERLHREARHAGSIQHPNVASIYDFGEDGDDRYIVMELVRGETLKDLIRRGPLPEDEALTMAERVARGLEAAHEQGVIHRDLKPHNVIVGADGQPHIVDFGIARALGGTALTNTAAVLGTAHYFSPEQASGRVADHQSDLYSLGVVLFEALTGKVPFEGHNPVEIAMRHVQDTAPAPSSWRPGLRRATDEVVLRALEKDPSRRYASASAMAAALLRARDGAGPILARPAAGARRRRGSALLLPALVVAAALLATAALARGTADRVEPAARPTAAAFSATPATPAPRGSGSPLPAAPATTPEPTRAAVPVAVVAQPDGAVREFYARVAGRDFAGAAALWTERMRSEYPPAQHLDRRFSSTTGLQLLRNEIVAADAAGGTATVAIDLLETTTSGTQRWAGTWQLVRGSDGWLLDRPALAAR